MEIENHWQEIFGEAMPPEVLTRVLKIQKIMNIKDDDAVWQILIPMEFYQRLHEQIPASMRAEVDVVTRQVKEASAQVIRAATVEIEKNQAAARLEIEKTTAAQKAELVKTLSTVLPQKLGEALSSIESKIDKGSGRMKVAIITLAIALGVTVGGGLALFFLGENIGQQTIQQQRG